MIFTKAFWKGAGERALKTFIQAFIPIEIAALGVSTSGDLNVWTAPWLASTETASGLALGATFLSFCTSLGNATFTAGSPTAAPAPAPAQTPAPAPIVTVNTVPQAEPSRPVEQLPPAVQSPDIDQLDPDLVDDDPVADPTEVA